MSSKRDQLKKLKQSRTTQPIREMPSPAEDKLNELETYENQGEIQKETLKAEMQTVSEPQNERKIEVSAADNATEVQEKEVPIKEVQKDQPKPEAKAEWQSEEKPETLPEPVQKEEPEAEAEVKTGKELEGNVQKSKEKTKRTSMALLVENNKFIRLRSMQLGMSIQDYVNLLINEEVVREKSEQAVDMGDITENLDMNYRRGQNSTIVALVLKESNAKFLKRGGAMHGMNSTTFLNHIISEEQQREKTNGPRKGVFDD